MSNFEYTYTYRHPLGTHTVGEVAQWVRSKTDLPTADAMCIARCLLKGESWRPENVRNPEDAGPCHFESVYVEDDYTLAYEARMAEYAAGQALAHRGAAGDTEAAIEFCKLFLTGAMHSHAMG